MKKILGIALATVIVLSVGLFACGEPSAREYTVTIMYTDNTPVAEVGISVGDNGEVAKGITDSMGSFTFTAVPDEYAVRLSNLPTGYNATQAYKTSKDKFSLTIKIASGVIKESIPEDKIYQKGDIVYDFTITDVDGEAHTLSQMLSDKPMVMLNFWNTNCVPCVSEMPALQKVYAKYSDKAYVLAINCPIMGNDTEADIRDFRDTNSYSFIFATDSIDYTKHLNIGNIPVTVVINRSGVIVELIRISEDESGFERLFSEYAI